MASYDVGDIAISASYITIFGSPGAYHISNFGPAAVPFPSPSWQNCIEGNEGIIVVTKANCFDNPPFQP